MLRILILAGLLAMGSAPEVYAQGWDPRTQETVRSKLVERADETIQMYQEIDSSLAAFFDSAYGWAVFPRVGKGAIAIGGARGKGVLYQGGKPARTAYLRQYTLGLSFGGKTYSEIIFFRDRESYDRFKGGDFSFSAQATAVLMSDGAGATNDYSDDVAVFTREGSGAMFEASIGGQKFVTRELR